jgi:hypothetical protein
MIAVLCLIPFWAASAQDAPAADPSKTIADLQRQVAQLQQQTRLTAAQQLQQAQDSYAAVIKEAKEKIGPGCKQAGGRWMVMVAPDGKPTAGCVQK